MNHRNSVQVHDLYMQVVETKINFKESLINQNPSNPERSLTISLTRCNIFVNPEITNENLYFEICIKHAIV